MKPHKHADVIKAWADGHEIEMFTDNGKWENVPHPSWMSGMEYRIKPLGNPDSLVYAYVTPQATFMEVQPKNANVIFTFDGFTQQLKMAQVRL